MNVIKIGCEISNQCHNYKMECGNCNQNWEIPIEEREEYNDFSEDYDIECDYDCDNCEFESDCC